MFRSAHNAFAIVASYAIWQSPCSPCFADHSPAEISAPLTLRLDLSSPIEISIRATEGNLVMEARTAHARVQEELPIRSADEGHAEVIELAAKRSVGVVRV